MSSKSSSIPSASPLPFTNHNAEYKDHSAPYFRSELTEQTEHVLPLVPVTQILAFRVNQGPSERMSLFPVLADLDAPRCLVALKEPCYDAEWEILSHIRDEHLHGRGLCTEGGVSAGPPWVSGTAWTTEEYIHEVEVRLGYRVTQSVQCAEVVLESSWRKSFRNLRGSHDFGESSPFPILQGHQPSNPRTTYMVATYTSRAALPSHSIASTVVVSSEASEMRSFHISSSCVDFEPHGITG